MADALTRGRPAEVLEYADYEAAVEDFFRNKWTDGLAVVPPSEAAVRRFVDHVRRDPLEVLGTVPPQGGVVTVEKLAINAVMAGCRPEYFPVVLAAFDALLDPHHNLNGVLTTTHCCVPMIIVNGPIARELEVNNHYGVFGAGYRANGTIGRAISLILWNAGGSYPWGSDRSTNSHPGEWSFCISENEAESPWTPFSADRGFPAGTNTVTVFACEAPHSILTYGTIDEMLGPLCSAMATLANNNSHATGEMLLTINPSVACYFHEHGWSKQRLKQYLFEHATVSKKAVNHGGPIARQMTGKYWPKRVMESPLEDEPVTLVERPEDLHIVVAGGYRYFSTCCPGWGKPGGFAVTREIVLPH